MNAQTDDTGAAAASRPAAGTVARRGTASFRLMRYFVVTSFIAFTIVAVTLYFLQGMEISFFEKVQREQSDFFAQTQAKFARRQEAVARDNLLTIHEAGHVNLARVFANELWEKDLSPFVARVQQLPAEPCRAIAEEDTAAGRACFAGLGARIIALPGFAAIDARVRAMMHDSTVFKVKVFDLRGITVYSSERAQIGEDASANRGRTIASTGRPASELTHRDQFSAFEGIVENRDLISSYIPVLDPGTARIAGVFEIYSDATQFLKNIREASAELASHAAANQARLERTSMENLAEVKTSSERFLAIVGGLLVLLYLALLLLVRNAQRIIDLQAQAQERMIRREQRWHGEKMTALATMAANVAHEVGNPLATISALAEDIAEQRQLGEVAGDQPQLILEQTRRIAHMTRQIADFAGAHSELPELSDINPMVKAVCDFLGFDHRFRAMRIEFHPGAGLPARMVVADHLNEALMNLLQLGVEGEEPAGGAVCGRIRVETVLQDGDVLIRIAFDPPRAPSDEASRFESARRRIEDMGGRIAATPELIEIRLPQPEPAPDTIQY